MKICPLVTQACIMEAPADDLLVREADDNDIPEKVSDDDSGESESDIFMNPDHPDSEEDGEDAGREDAEGGLQASIVAKNFRGEVRCLGALCRFHNDETSGCRFEEFLAQVDHRLRLLALRQAARAARLPMMCASLCT